MQIIKIGGSLFHQPAVLKNWLETLAAESINETIILVPGGGPFADLIRHAQADFSLSESQAHRLAIDAMGQFGRLLEALSKRAQLFYLSTTELPASGLHIWLPNPQELIQTSLAQDWTVTSDSIALWLAQRHQQPLTLLKSATQLSESLHELTKNQQVDTAFRTQYLSCPVPLRLINVQSMNKLKQTDWKIFDD